MTETPYEDAIHPSELAALNPNPLDPLGPSLRSPCLQCNRLYEEKYSCAPVCGDLTKFRKAIGIQPLLPNKYRDMIPTKPVGYSLTRYLSTREQCAQAIARLREIKQITGWTIKEMATRLQISSSVIKSLLVEHQQTVAVATHRQIMEFSYEQP